MTSQKKKVQVVILKKSLDIVAKDTDVDRISSMVRLNTQVHKLVHKNEEMIMEYIARFKDPAFVYLNIVRTDNISAGVQIFAMPLMINARLGAQSSGIIISTLLSGPTCIEK